MPRHRWNLNIRFAREESPVDNFEWIISSSFSFPRAKVLRRTLLCVQSGWTSKCPCHGSISWLKFLLYNQLSASHAPHPCYPTAPRPALKGLSLN
ncbi:hypothetical protein CDAR_13321 [Caerostris darwini]|uniref:Uncharacterized protein n=1 Tax=Caerostris darwini TaxID=1538125 RepID=A0AAV4R4V5_9ARAC|nr:hypothetical protein CDAR_13321 [Caerostris darwini]